MIRSRIVRSQPLRIAAVALALVASALPAQRGAAADPALMQARGLLDAGNAAAAESAYTAVLRRGRPPAPGIRAAALFGRSFAMQQRLLRGDTAFARADTGEILRGFREAVQLNPRAYRSAVDNNSALLFEALGNLEAAMAVYRAALERGGSASAAFYANLARAYERTGAPDSALRYYRAAFRIDSTRPDVLRRIYVLMLPRESARSILDLSRRWHTDTTNATVVVLSVATLLVTRNPALPLPAGRGGRGVPGAPVPRLTAEESARALTVIAASLPHARIGPASFHSVLGDQLRQASSNLAINAGVAALVAAFVPRREPIPERAAPSWWRETSERRAAWSSALRWLGDGYRDLGRADIAASYYEAAIDGAQTDPQARWIDRGALLPLALVYLERGDERSLNAINDLDRMQRTLVRATETGRDSNDLKRARDFHLTLGAIYAERDQWSGADARNAQYQLEQLRTVSGEVERVTRAPARVPPALLEQLGAHYVRSGDRARADAVKGQLRRDLEVRNRAGEVESSLRRIEEGRPTKIPVNRAALQQVRTPTGPALERVVPVPEPVTPVRPATRPPPAETAAVTPPPRRTEAVTTRVLREVLVAGQVVGPNGQPIPRASVQLRTPEAVMDATTDARGQFTFRLRTTQMHGTIAVSANGYLSTAADSVALPNVDSDLRPLRIQLRPQR